MSDRPLEEDFQHLGEAAYREFCKAVSRWDRARKKARSVSSATASTAVSTAAVPAVTIGPGLLVQSDWIVTHLPSIADDLEVDLPVADHRQRSSGRRGSCAAGRYAERGDDALVVVTCRRSCTAYACIGSTPHARCWLLHCMCRPVLNFVCYKELGSAVYTHSIRHCIPALERKTIFGGAGPAADL